MMMCSCVVLLTLGQAPAATDQPPNPHAAWLEALGWHFVESRAPGTSPHSESQKMLAAFLSGSMAGPGDGWFAPSRGRHDWKWLAQRYGGADGAITSARFKGQADLFERLDRDRDGNITALDLDWSDQSPFLRQMHTLNPWIYKLDADSNGRISRKEWLDFFEKAARGKDHLTPEDLRMAVMPPATPPKAKGPPKGMPTTKMLLTALFKNELGSPFEGPRPGSMVPDFTLEKYDSTATVTLSKLLGEKPVVLIFGSFT